ncbi:MAG: DegT/DnrJ/EryC1/StrS family aminotransferase [Ignavibacteriales bacterium]|nr:DegT/DnrJ/EryC1/StrS family aminotransferase [Ignavibacteriales bacterium]
MKVPYTAFDIMNAPIRQQLIAAFENVIDSGRYIQGPECAAFEQEFALFCDTPFASGTSNGTDSLYLILRAIGVGPGDEVITAPNSFIASASTIALVGAKPVFVDVTEDLNIDPDKIEEAITQRTKAIVPVHLTGRPAKLVKINQIAKKHNLFVLEDAAQSVGAKLKDKRVGSWGDAASFSLHPLKNLHAFGDAGIITTKDTGLIERFNISKNHGLRNRDQCDFWSFNCRLDELQAALLRIQLRELERWTKERRELAFRYNRLLGTFVKVPLEAPNEFHVYQTYVVLAEHRNELQKFLRENGVEALVHYPTPIHMQPAAAGLNYRPEDFPVTLQLSKRIISLPLYPGLTHEQQDFVVDLIGTFYKK